MWYYVYILQSKKDGNFYTGYTKNLKLRLVLLKLNFLFNRVKRDAICLVRSIYRANGNSEKCQYLEEFFDNFEILKLEVRLCSLPGRSIAFIVDKPVKREIFTVDFRDRVVHHLIIFYNTN
ncbi:MAG: GIY-YIG nuclease family protein [Bacteroidales bacterium]|nr:GIY-YIG nuclease family protein [Bacteroidales bacterium]